MRHHAKKRFGQNFLVDRNIVDKIIDCIHPGADDCIVEIGPGLGALSCPLLEHVERLHVIELDRDIIPRLQEHCKHAPNLIVHQQDVLTFDFGEFRHANCPQSRLRVIGNLPYNISTAVLFHLLQYRDIIHDMHFMLQKEVVDRIAAATNDSNYGRLSVMLQTWFDTQPLFEVPATCFRPVPRVQSAIIRLVPRAVSIEHPDAYARLVRKAFSQRRKTLRNTLKGMCTASCIEHAGIDPGRRPQELDTGEYLHLHQVLMQNPDAK